MNFTRSARAPLIRAGVMIANIIWKTAKAIEGIVKTRCVAAKPLSTPSVPSSFVRPKNSKGLPTRPPPTSLPKAIE